MDTKKFATRESKRAGFTLVELLVVIGIIALLISMLLPALSRAKRQAIIVQCAARMNNNGIALLNYAADFKGQLPQTFGNSENPSIIPDNAGAAQGGNWIWDMQVATRNLLVRYGATRTSMYCPSNPAQNANALWNFSVTAYPGGTAVPLGPNVGNVFGNDTNGNSYDGPGNMPPETGFGVMGYIWLLNRLDGGFPCDKYTIPLSVTTPGLIASNPIPAAHINHWAYQSTIRPKNTPDSLGNVKANVSSETEICIDATVSTNTAPYNFGDVIGGWSQPHQSSHWFGGLPIGGNVLYLDGHVAWRPANTNKPAGPEVVQMVRRTTVTGLNFWW